MENKYIESLNKGEIIRESNKNMDPIHIQELKDIENFLNSLIDIVKQILKLEKTN